MSWAERLSKSRWLPLLLLACVCGFFFFYGLSSGELYRNETLRAIIAREMLRTGNGVVPTLYGEPLFTKPPGMYVLIALFSWPFGDVTEWTARLPSACAATATVFMMYWFFARYFDRRAGLLAALLLPMSAFWLERSTSAEIDMVQVAWVVAAILFFLRAVDVRLKPDLGEVRPNGWWLLAALVCVAGGTLTKWTAPAFFYGTVVPFLWWRGRLGWLWGRQHLAGVLVAAGLVMAWMGAAVAQTSWSLFYETVSREALNHLAPGHNHKAYPWLGTLLYPLKVLGTMLPWSAVALLALRPAFARHWNENERFVLQALHCWAWPNLLFWGLAPEHALRNSAPMFPALSGLAVMVGVAWGRSLRAWPWPRVRPARIFTCALVAWMIVKVLFIQMVVSARDAQRHTRDKADFLASLVPVTAVLYLFKLKDEGIMFYFGRPVLRLSDPDALPATPGPLFCILTEEEWTHWHSSRAAAVVEHMQDAQGENIVLVCLH